MFSSAIHENADQSAGVSSQCRQLTSELLGDQALGRQTPLAQQLKLTDLARLEPIGIAEDRDRMRLMGGCPSEM